MFAEHYTIVDTVCHMHLACAFALRSGLDKTFWLVSEFHENGNLRDYLVANELSWSVVVKLGLGIAKGLSYLHAENSNLTSQPSTIKPSIGHRDIKSRNILVKSDLTACIADFGLAIRFETGQAIGDAHFQVGTRRYMAPEVLDGAIQFSRDAFLRIDVYSMGLVLWELMSRCYIDPHRPTPYQAPFEAEIGTDPPMDVLQHNIVNRKLRPQPKSWWLENNFSENKVRSVRISLFIHIRDGPYFQVIRELMHKISCLDYVVILFFERTVFAEKILFRFML